MKNGPEAATPSPFPVACPEGDATLVARYSASLPLSPPREHGSPPRIGGDLCA